MPKVEVVDIFWRAIVDALNSTCVVPDVTISGMLSPLVFRVRVLLVDGGDDDGINEDHSDEVVLLLSDRG